MAPVGPKVQAWGRNPAPHHSLIQIPPVPYMLLTPCSQSFCWAPARIQRYESKFDGGHTYLFAFMKIDDN